MQVLNGVCAIMAIQKVCPHLHLVRARYDCPEWCVAVAVWPWNSTDYLQRIEHLCGLHMGRYIATTKDTVCDEGQHKKQMFV